MAMAMAPAMVRVLAMVKASATDWTTAGSSMSEQLADRQPSGPAREHQAPPVAPAPAPEREPPLARVPLPARAQQTAMPRPRRRMRQGPPTQLRIK
jgi:hypothetical protein